MKDSNSALIRELAEQYFTGITRSPDFPTTPGAFDTTQNGAFDVFVTKVNGTATALLYSTFLGGLDFDGGGALAIDPTGNATVAGGTSSPDFPTMTGAFRTVLNGFSDGFVTKLNASGSALVYSTFLGGSDSDDVAAIRLDEDGNSWLAGSTASPDFPITAGAFDATFNGLWDVFVAELNANGSALAYSTFLGGTDSEGPSDLARGTDGALYLTGQTASTDFPTTAGAFDRVFNGDPLIFWADAFVAKLTPGGTQPPPPAPSKSTLTVTVTGRNGRVTSTPSGISVTTGNTGSASFTNGTAITLSSTRDAEWSGACSSGGKKTRTCKFTITKNSTVRAELR